MSSLRSQHEGVIAPENGEQLGFRRDIHCETSAAQNGERPPVGRRGLSVEMSGRLRSVPGTILGRRQAFVRCESLAERLY